jgi:hypothetical protein
MTPKDGMRREYVDRASEPGVWFLIGAPQNSTLGQKAPGRIRTDHPFAA